MATLVKEIMTPANSVVTISAFAKVRELLQIMGKHKCKSVVVEKRNPSDAFGIVTYTNILDAIYKEDGDIDLLNVYDIMTKPVIQISCEIDIDNAATMMVMHNINRLLVTKAEVLEGIISMSDIAEILIQKAVKEN